MKITATKRDDILKRSVSSGTSIQSSAELDDIISVLEKNIGINLNPSKGYIFNLGDGSAGLLYHDENHYGSPRLAVVDAIKDISDSNYEIVEYVLNSWDKPMIPSSLSPTSIESDTAVDDLDPVLGRQYRGYGIQTTDYSVLVRDSSGNIVFECVNDKDAYEWIDSILDKPDDVESNKDITAATLSDIDYLEQLGDLTINTLQERGYSADVAVDDRYITINIYKSDSLDEIISTYLQPIEYVEVAWDDLELDALTLAEVVMDGADHHLFSRGYVPNDHTDPDWY